MSHAIAALSNPAVVLPSAQSQMQQAMAKAKAATSGTTSTTGTGTNTNAANATTDLGSTFLNLLATELKNQDPTAPVDSTQMVGQMISLNQLDQLISINQVLGASPTSATGATASPTATAASATPAAAAAGNSGVTPALDPASLLSNPQTTLPFDPNTMMPIATTPVAQTSISGAK